MNTNTFEIPHIENYSEEDYTVTEQMLNALVHNYANNLGSTSILYWIDKYSSNKEANRMIVRLAMSGYITTECKHANYATMIVNEAKLLEWYSKDELSQFIINTKLDKYAPTAYTPKSSIEGATDVKLPSGIAKTGLVRTGFVKASQNKYKYDIPMLLKYQNHIVKYTAKSMTKMEAKLGYSLENPRGYDYESIIKLVIANIVENKDLDYNLGKLVQDSRGRAIFNTVRKVFNIISNKIARSLIVAPPCSVTADGLTSAFLSIAELTSGFEPTVRVKVANGKQAYANRTLHKLNLKTEKGLDTLYENIWLERLYADLDAYYADNTHQFTTPVEIDFKASNMTIIGLLVGHKDYVSTSKYMWKIDGLTKFHVKFAQTPYVFGSSASVQSLWTKNNLSFTDDQVDIMRREQRTGKFAIANELKDIIIQHSQPTKRMQLHVGNEKFIVECNRYKNVGDYSKNYVVYDSSSKTMKIVTHTKTKKVEDLEQFHRYFSTALIHNLDSQVMNNMCKGVEWVLPIHDAGIVTIAEASKFRKLAVTQMRAIYANRKSILENYFKSINLDTKGWVRYAKLLETIAQCNSSRVTISPYLLA